MFELPQTIYEAVERAKERIIGSCKRCDGTGIYKKRRCGCRYAHEVIVLLAFAGVPEEYWWYKLKEFPGSSKAKAEVQTYIDHIPAMYKDGLGILLVGNYGTGKTSLGCGILKEVVKYRIKNQDEDGFRVQYKTLSQIITELLALEKGQGKEFRREMMADFLFIDEIDKEYTTKSAGWKFAIFDQLLRDRKANKLSTILSSNIPFDTKNPEALSMEKYYGDSIMSILRSMLHVVRVGGIDLRVGTGSKRYKQIVEGEKNSEVEW